MRKTLFVTTLTAAALCALAAPVAAQQSFTGDTKLACEAVMCLASPTKPQECMSAIRKYFSITARKPHEQITKRRNFLKLCPQDNNALIEGIVNGQQCNPLVQSCGAAAPPSRGGVIGRPREEKDPAHAL